MITRKTYAGLFFVTLSTLMYEILLTRIFSVSMWYHFAFMAISIAMFGMTVGAIIVYLYPEYFRPERAPRRLALFSFYYSLAIVFSFLSHLCIPFFIDTSLVGVFSIVLTYVVISIPFVFSGICVCLALTKFPNAVGKLYAVDLAGAALGCVMLIAALSLTDGPTAVIFVSFLAGLGAVFFSLDAGGVKFNTLTILSCVALFTFAAVHTAFVWTQNPWMRMVWIKGRIEPKPLFERWNSFSCVKVWGDLNKPEPVAAWGPSPAMPPNQKINQLHLNIDSLAATVMTDFKGDLGKVEYLKYDIVNFVHHYKSDADVLVIGSGGGRDVLSALAFKQKSILGVEINQEILDIVNRVYGDFTGHLDRDPRITFVNDEARSFVARIDNRFDIIQVSFIDTWAATAAGAYVLSENSLYTVEAWKNFIEHLNPKGILTFSRWYFRDLPGEAYRVNALAVASLRELGAQNPRDHIVMLRALHGNTNRGVVTLLLSKTPYSDDDLARIEQIAANLKFDVIFSRKVSDTPIYAVIASSDDLNAFAASFPVNIAPTTDDSPFFFNMLRLRDLFNRSSWNMEINIFNLKAVLLLGVLLLTVVVLTTLCILFPLFLTGRPLKWPIAFPHFLYFACIGLGFMLIEISQMQRLIIFLGHPIYGLTVVLFALLLSSGLGSFLTQPIGKSSLRLASIVLFLLLLGTIYAFGVYTPKVCLSFQASNTPIRILTAIGILSPMGLFMGMAFPLGMKIAGFESPAMTPWLWGINGATSVCASVLAVVLSLSSGISTSFWTGFACYGISFLSLLWTGRALARSVPAAGENG